MEQLVHRTVVSVLAGARQQTQLLRAPGHVVRSFATRAAVHSGKESATETRFNNLRR